MTVKELKAVLAAYPDDMPVVREWFSEDLQDVEWDSSVKVVRREVYDYFRHPKKYEAVVIA
jgi:hypothetical protein